MPTPIEPTINYILALDGQRSYNMSFPCSRVSTIIKMPLAIHLDNEQMARRQFFRENLRMSVNYL
jgi:uncharacterized metal-binding protein YceD (DUF177 family)